MEENTGIKVPEDEENLNPDDFDEDETTEGDDKPEGEENPPKQPESEEGQAEEEEKKRRAEYAKRRREREAAEKAKREQEEREARIRKEAAEQEALGLITKNPYTGKPIRDANDLEIYKIQRAIDERGGDPIADLADEMAERNRRAAAERKKAEEEARMAGDTLNQQIAELRKAHPEVDTRKLADDPDFMALADEKKGRWTLLEVYEETIRRKAAKPKPEDEETARELARKRKQPGHSGGGSTQSDPLSGIKTLDEFNEYWKKKYH